MSPSGELFGTYPSLINTSSGTTSENTQQNLSGRNRGDLQAPKRSDPSYATMRSANNGFDANVVPSEMQQDPAPSCPTAETATWIQKLSEINVRLFQHVATIPSLQDSALNGSESLEAPKHKWNDRGLAIDKTFNLSQLLIEALNHLYSRPLQNSSTQTSPPSPPGSGSTTPDPTLSCINNLDQGSILLVLSSYLRLIDAYDRIFRNMQASLTSPQQAASTKSYLSNLRLPQLTIGGFSPAPTSVVQTTLIVHLTETLLARIRLLVGSMESSAGLDGAAESGNESPGDTTLRAIRIKEKEMMKRVNSIKRMCSNRLLRHNERW